MFKKIMTFHDILEKIFPKWLNEWIAQWLNDGVAHRNFSVYFFKMKFFAHACGINFGMPEGILSQKDSFGLDEY
jgi:hypothetical protein